MASVPTSTLAQTISTYAGDGAVAYFRSVSNPSKIALDSDGNFYVSDSLANKVFRITPRGIMTTVAGSGVKGYGGDGGDARSAKLNNPAGVNHDRLGNLFITDSGNMVIRKVAPTGAITTVAGNGTQGDTGDGGPAINAQMDLPEHVVVDAEENLFVAEYGGNRVRRVAADGTISTVAGTGLQGYAGDGGPAINA